MSYAGANKRKTARNKRSINARAKQAEALAMVRSGMTYSQAAEKIGLTKQRIGQYVKAALGEFRDQVAADIADVRAMELARIDRLAIAVDKRIDATIDSKEGVDLKAVETMRRLLERRATLLGADVVPVKKDEGLELLRAGKQITINILQFTPPAPSNQESVGEVLDGIGVTINEVGAAH